MAPDHERLKRWLALLGSTSLALLIACVYLTFRLASATAAVALPDADDADALRTASRKTATMFAAHPDPDVDMTFIPGLKDVPAWNTNVSLTTNGAGLRDHRPLRPKPDGTFRVVLLGDSFVAGAAAPYEDTLARQLEGLIRTGAEHRRVEVRPIGVGGWNLISEIAWLSRNFESVQPDAIVHVMCANDMDSGYGFVGDNVRSATWDGQRVFGRVHFSLASPMLFARRATEARGLIGSGLIPSSRARWQISGERLRALRQLAESRNCIYLAYLLQPDALALGAQALDVPARDVLLCPAEALEHNLLPADGHPNRQGYAIMAEQLAAALAQRTDVVSQSKSFTTLADRPDFEAERQAREFYAAATIPSAFDPTSSEDATNLRCVVGGVYRGGVLAPEAVIVLRRDDQSQLTAELQLDDAANLRGGKLRVSIQGRTILDATIGSDPSVRVDASLQDDDGDLIELRIECDRWHTAPNHRFRDGVYGPMPRIGRLLGASLN